MRFYFSDFLNLFFSVFHWLITTDIFLSFIYIFFATSIIVVAQKIFKLVFNL